MTVTTSRDVLAPVLLIGGGMGAQQAPAPTGLPYLATHLRKHGIEAYVKMCGTPRSHAELRTFMETLLGRIQPRVVGVSIKFFHHITHGLHLCRLVRDIDPEIRIVIGGDTATYYWRDFATFDCIDHIVLGDGEAPLLQICRSDPDAPNTVTTRGGEIVSTPQTFVQDADSFPDSYPAYYDDVFLDARDQHTSGGWIVAGRGCSQHCLYCPGNRGMQARLFKRSKPFRRAEAAVARDIDTVKRSSFMMSYDFTDLGFTDWEGYFETLWSSLDLTNHYLSYFSWINVTPTMVALIARTYQHAQIHVDVGCFSERQRRVLSERGDLKRPWLRDQELFSLLSACDPYPNLGVQVHAVAGLPALEPSDFDAERRLVDRLFEHPSFVTGHYNPLHAQPGASVAVDPSRYSMTSQVESFEDYRRWYDDPNNMPPRLIHQDLALDRAMVASANAFGERFHDRAAQSQRHLPDKRGLSSPLLQFAAYSKVRMKQKPCGVFEYPLRRWLGEARAEETGLDKDKVVTLFDNGYGTHLLLADETSGPAGGQIVQRSLYEATRRQFTNEKDIGSAYQALKQSHDVSMGDFITCVKTLNRMSFLTLV